MESKDKQSIIKKKYDFKNIFQKKNKIEVKKINNIRISTYNIHYWTDVYEKPSLTKILEDIKYINSDVLFLQEVVFGIKYELHGKTVNTEKIINKLESLGYFIIFCNTLPTWFGGIYGNMMCIKNRYKNIIDNTNYTFEKSIKSCIVSGNKEGTKETRCYIKLEFLDFVIIGVHLDVCSEIERKKQIKMIIKLLDNKKYKNKKLIILGDFNTTDIRQYSDNIIKNEILNYVFNNNRYQMNNGLIKLIKNNNFKSSTESLNINNTCWSGIQTDYIFIKGVSTFKPQIYYTNNSDHLPLIIDIKLNK